MLRTLRSWLLLACCGQALVLGSCGVRREPTCRFGVEHTVHATGAEGFDDLAMATLGGARAAVFSDATGLWLLRLDASGKPLEDARRIAGRCSGGVDVLDAVDASDATGTSLVACMRTAADGGELGGGLFVYSAGAHGPAAVVAEVARVGSRSRGVSMARVGSRLLVGFQDAVVGQSRAQLVELKIHAGAPLQTPEPRLLSDPAWLASAPRLATQGEQVFAVWSERSGYEDGAPGRLMFAEASRSRVPATVLTTRHEAPDASLVPLEDDLTVVFRDLREGKRRTGLHLARVSEEGRLLGEVLRVARADGSGRPVLRQCQGRLLAATPRTFAGDALVGAVGVDLGSSAVSGEQQFYEDSREFSQVASVCAGPGALLLIAERSSRGRGTAALHSVPFSCR